MAAEGPMRFFLDETSFELPGEFDIGSLEASIEDLVRLIRSRHGAGEDVFCWSKLAEETEVTPGKFLCDLLYQPAEMSGVALDPDVRMALFAVLNRCVYWDERVAPPADPGIEINGRTFIARTVAVVHALIGAGNGACCLALGTRATQGGAHLVRSGGSERQIHFVLIEAHVPLFFRSLPEIEDMGPDAYLDNARRAFPDIVLAPGLASQFGRFQTPYLEIRPLVTKHLSVLNDHFQRVHREWKDKTDDAIGAYGIDASLERGATHKNKQAMSQRTVVIEGIPIVCEWHTKIKRHIDRIHFDPGHAGVFGGKLVVGHFVDHFDT